MTKIETDGGGQRERKVIEKKEIGPGSPRVRDGIEGGVRERQTVRYVYSTYACVLFVAG